MSIKWLSCLLCDDIDSHPYSDGGYITVGCVYAGGVQVELLEHVGEKGFHTAKLPNDELLDVVFYPDGLVHVAGLEVGTVGYLLNPDTPLKLLPQTTIGDLEKVLSLLLNVNKHTNTLRKQITAYVGSLPIIQTELDKILAEPVVDSTKLEGWITKAIPLEVGLSPHNLAYLTEHAPDLNFVIGDIGDYKKNKTAEIAQALPMPLVQSRPGVQLVCSHGSNAELTSIPHGALESASTTNMSGLDYFGEFLQAEMNGMTVSAKISFLTSIGKSLAEATEEEGLRIRIDQVSNKPFAMGNTSPKVTVYRTRILFDQE